MKKRIRQTAPYVLLGGIFAVLLFLNAFYQDNWLDSDMAAEMIFSKLLAKEGSLIATTNWYYSTEFRILYTQLVMAPLFCILSSWHVIRFITNVIFYIVLLAAWFYAVRPLRLQRSYAVLAGSILLLPFSETMVLHVVIGNTYMSHMILLYFAFGMFLRLALGEKKGVGKVILLALYLLLSIILGMSGVRYLLALECPLFLAAVLFAMQSEAFGAFRQDMDKASGKALLETEEMAFVFYSFLSLVAAVVGYILNALFISAKYVFQTYGATNFISIYQGVLFDRIQNALGTLLMLFGYIPDRGFLSLRGLISICAFVLLGVIIYCVYQVYKNARKVRFFLALFVLVTFILNLFVFIFTTSTMVSRYYLTIFMFVLPLLAVYVEEEKRKFDRLAVILLLVGTLGLGSVKTVYSVMTVDKNESKRAVAAFLEEEGYTFGFAIYENGNIITELTQGAVEIANIGDPQYLDFFTWSSPVAYYEDGYHAGTCFMLLTAQEALNYADANPVLCGEKVYDDGAYVVYVYESVEMFVSTAESR